MRNVLSIVEPAYCSKRVVLTQKLRFTRLFVNYLTV